jgi:hypothetical protein
MAHIDTRPYSTPGTDAWSRAAVRVLALAAARGCVVDRAALALYDVRDLQALARRWESRDAADHRATRWWRRIRSRPTGAAASPVRASPLSCIMHEPGDLSVRRGVNPRAWPAWFLP